MSPLPHPPTLTITSARGYVLVQDRTVNQQIVPALRKTYSRVPVYPRLMHITLHQIPHYTNPSTIPRTTNHLQELPDPTSISNPQPTHPFTTIPDQPGSIYHQPSLVSGHSTKELRITTTTTAKSSSEVLRTGAIFLYYGRFASPFDTRPGEEGA